MVLWLIEHRALVSAIAAVASSGMVWSHMPWPAADPILVMIEFQRPALYMGLHVTYAVMLFTTPYITTSVLMSLAYIFFARKRTPSVRSQPLAYIEPERRKDLTLVIGECHHTNRPTPCSNPHWLTVPERGLFTGIAIIGAIGSGKTSGCMYPFAKQILGFRRTDPARRIGGLVLEVKGDFCHQVRAVLNAHGRAGDYVEVGLEGPWRYNPLHNDLDAYALAYGIASLLNNVFGKGKEPFWQQAYTNLVKFIILLHKVLNGYVTLFEVYECAINPDLLAERIAEADRQLARVETVLVDPETYLAHRVLATYPFELDTATGRMRAQATVDLKGCLDANRIPYDERNDVRNADAHDMRRAQFEAVKRWFDNDWRRIEPKLRTSIVEGISVFLSLFDDNPTMKCAFCPPKECYDPIANADGHYGVPLPPFADLIESGKVCALNFPVAANPGLAKTIGTLMKQDFQRAVLSRIPSMAATPNRHRRAVLFMCDEYHAFATVGEADPTGDEKFFSLSRQAKCIPIVATQSVSSLRSALPGESWRTLLQTFRTKVFLAMSDDYSTRVASDLCGKEEQLKLHYNISESGQDARVSVLTGRTAAHKATITTSKSYAVQRDYVFEPKVFAELKNAQAVVLAYDGQNPLPPTYCYLKPYYLNPNVSYFDQVARGEL
jgi:hypothetical protein